MLDTREARLKEKGFDEFWQQEFSEHYFQLTGIRFIKSLVSWVAIEERCLEGKTPEQAAQWSAELNYTYKKERREKR